MTDNYLRYMYVNLFAVGEKLTDNSVREAVSRLFNKLRSVGKARGHLQQFRYVYYTIEVRGDLECLERFVSAENQG